MSRDWRAVGQGHPSVTQYHPNPGAGTSPLATLTVLAFVLRLFILVPLTRQWLPHTSDAHNLKRCRRAPPLKSQFLQKEIISQESPSRLYT